MQINSSVRETESFVFWPNAMHSRAHGKIGHLTTINLLKGSEYTKWIDSHAVYFAPYTNNVFSFEFYFSTELCRRYFLISAKKGHTFDSIFYCFSFTTPFFSWNWLFNNFFSRSTRSPMKYIFTKIRFSRNFLLIGVILLFWNSKMWP